jgi:uncharacterized protein
MEKIVTPNHVAFSLANLKQLVFEVTDACNLKCAYCAYGEFYNDYDNRENKFLSIDRAVKLIDYLAVFWNSEMNISANKSTTISFYGGEPLLNMHFIKVIIEYLNDKFKNTRLTFKYSMTTNGLLLNKYMDFLKEQDFNLLISLDGNKDNTSYRVDKRGCNAYDKIVTNIDLLKTKYPDYFSKKVNFNAVLHNRNSVEEIYRYFKVNYDKIPRIGELNNVGIKDSMQKTFKETYKNATQSLQQSEHYEEIENDMFMNAGNYKNLALYLHRYSDFYYKDYTDLLIDNQTKRIIPTGTCFPFSKKMFVTVNNKILPCERIGHKYALGEISNSGVDINLSNIADKYNIYYSKMKKQCTSCKRIKSCVQCMFNLKNLETNPVCFGFMNEEKFESFTKNQMDFLKKHPEAYAKIMENVLVF